MTGTEKREPEVYIKRDQQIHFFMSKDETRQLRQKMEEAGVENQSAYLRKMALDGYCINLDISDIQEMTGQIRRLGNNLNQYAKRANETGNIYAADVEELKDRLNEIWGMAKSIDRRMSEIF